MPWSTPWWSSRGLSLAGLAGALLVGLGCGGNEPLPASTDRPQQQAARRAPPGVAALPDAVTAALAAGTPVVAWAAGSQAKLEPCGCVAGMHGGLVRRASLLARADQSLLLSCEVGGWSGGAADYQLVKAGYYLRACQQAGIDVLGLGEAEVALGAEKLGHLLSLAGELGLPVACANLRSADGGSIVPAVQQIRAGGRDFAVTSVVGAEASGDGLRVHAADESLLALTATLDGASLVVLAEFPREELLALARAVPGIALVVGGAVHQPSPQPLAVGSARVVYAGNEGKTIGWYPWGGDACAFELVEDNVPDTAAIRELIGSYQEQLGAMDLAIDDRIGGMTTLVELGGDAASYVGSASCMACHQQAHQRWQDSSHAHALETLREKNYQLDPECLRCHVTGFARPDGYGRRGANAHLGSVGCESCHGRGSQHVVEHSAGRAATGTLVATTPATCLRCHDDENSPQFTYEAYWPRIDHDSR